MRKTRQISLKLDSDNDKIRLKLKNETDGANKNSQRAGDREMVDVTNITP